MSRLLADAASVFTPRVPVCDATTGCITCGDVAIPLTVMRLDEERVLTSYGWIERSAGIVRIPIDQAMTLTVERGLHGIDQLRH